MRLFLKTIFIFLFFTKSALAGDVTSWLKKEIDNILNTYNNINFSNVERFDKIEDTINKNFAGAGIAKFVAGQAWSAADKETKKTYIKLFKRHLALNIASLMQGYSNQTYSLIKTVKDDANNIFILNMEIKDQNNKILVSWRVKESKGKFYVIDLIVADISLVVTKRSEFNSMLKKEEYNLKKFNETLKAKNKLSYNNILENN